jgi:DNA-binding PadR family transcriptional regulator
LGPILPRHGYEIMKYIEEITEGEFTIGPATSYTLIKKMQEADYIRLLEDDDERRKTYSITEKGKSIISNEVNRRTRMASHGREVLEYANMEVNDHVKK